MPKNRLTKYGLTGNSGLGAMGLWHITAPYASNGRVFVWSQDRAGWERMTRKRAKLWRREVIECYCCTKPAVQIDHHFPYMMDQNLCKRHADLQIKQRERERAKQARETAAWAKQRLRQLAAFEKQSAKSNIVVGKRK